MRLDFGVGGKLPTRRVCLSTLITTFAVGLVVPASVVPLGSLPAAAASETTTICDVPRDDPRQEKTMRVSRTTAEMRLLTTPSYEGPCALYGQSASLGEGTLTAYSQSEGNVPKSIGLIMTDTTLDGLPKHPPQPPKDLDEGPPWCHDKNKNGTVESMHECSGGYENPLHLNEKFKSSVDTPFTYVLSNWNPHGHVPPGVWDKKHFDVHFYMNSNAERRAIKPGPHPIMVDRQAHALGNKLPAKKYIAQPYENIGAVEPGMGNHLVNKNSPEWKGGPFTQTFLYGSYNGNITFYEPMVTKQWYDGLRSGLKADRCFALKQPRAVQRSGWYPTQYCLKHRENRDELTTSLEGFVYRTAS